MKLKSMTPFSDHPENIERPLRLSIRFLSYQPRTIHEVTQFIRKKGVDEDDAKKIIKILLDKKYLDDMAFSKLFVQSKIRYKPKSKFALTYELNKKKVSPSIIEAVLEPYNDEDLALKAVTLKKNTWKNLEPETIKKKVMNFLRYRGFGYDISISTLNRFMNIND